MDVHTPKQRSLNMSRILAKNTAPEVKLRKILSSNGIRGYRLHYKVAGRPDIVFPKKKIAVFIDGCFWHGCRKCYIRPKTKKKFWDKKLLENQKRDRVVNRKLKSSGWKLIRVWEHEIENNLDDCYRRLKISYDIK